MQLSYFTAGLIFTSLVSGAFASDYKGRPYHPKSGQAIKVLPASDLPSSKIEFDFKFSPFMGANNFITFNRGLEKFDDAILQKGMRKTRGFGPFLWRATKQAFVYDLLASWFTVAQHEFFGHGYRIRDLGSGVASVTKYKIGLESGYTQFVTNPGITLSQNLAITIAGLESNYIFSREMKKQWVRSNQVFAREGALYRLNALVSLLYSMSSDSFTSISPFQLTPDHESSHDLTRYVALLNIAYPQKEFTRGRLDALILLNLLDPTLYFSLAADLAYVLIGRDTLPIPMLKFKSLKFLPNWRVELSPFGPEHYFEVFSTFKNRFIYIYGRGGKHGPNSYFGAGLDIRNLTKLGPIDLEAKLEAWKQPKMALSLYEAIPTSNLIGVLGSVTANYDMKAGGLFVELGGKTEGFVPGQSLKDALIFRLGLNIKY